MIPLIIKDQFYTIQNLQRSPIPQTSNWSGTFCCCFLQQTGSSSIACLDFLDALQEAFDRKPFQSSFTIVPTPILIVFSGTAADETEL